MHTTILTILLALAVSTSAFPSPSAKLTSTGPHGVGWVELYRQLTRNSSNNHHLIFLGPPNGSVPDTSQHQKRGSCSATSQPNCSGGHTARNDICKSLLTELNEDGQVLIPKSPRQICYKGDAARTFDNAYCCVSWGTAVDNLKKSDLVGYATTITSQCTQNGVSGKFSSVPLGPLSTCSEFCTSSRGTHCY